ncbi:AAA family ATPase [Acetobacter sp. TBRC 12305]|uniref:DNA 5'-3' helicase n=1 Tax=Acetobacter garciniae TaxID=2817435 RepID=A0A939KQI0_9PROT|nr:DnaB-like helicase C-terminal domain-containing protein [Acetobacter garciniae]MBO1325362.1 AAA family ATPase [Acetobacter garciniae]MBX0345466.1 AAA family ATPase [Acetobacter garciniae]
MSAFERMELAAEMPHDLAAEQAIIGGILTNNRAYDEVCEVLEGRFFYSPLNALFYQTAETMILGGHAANPVSLRPLLSGNDLVRQAGGWETIIGPLLMSMIGIHGIKGYAEQIRSAWLRRQMLALSGDMRDMIVRPDGVTAQDVVDHVEETMLEISTDRADMRTRHLTTAMDAVMVAAESASKASGVVGVPSGYDALDGLTGGFEAGTLTIIAGRPAMGKTAAGVGIAVRAAKATHKRVLYWSGEVSAEAISQRIIAAKTGIPVLCIRSGKNRGREVSEGVYGPGTPLRQEQWDRIVAARHAATHVPLLIDDTPAITVAKLYSAARRLARSKGGLAMVVVDYLALMRGTADARRQGKYAEVSEISADLLAMAKSLNVPVIALQQLNREVEKRDNKKPTKADLRDSGNLEQDASVIILLYREEYYLQQDGSPTQKPGESDMQWHARIDQYERAQAASAGKALWIIDKNRQGETGSIPMLFDGKGTWFRSISEGEGSEAW